MNHSQPDGRDAGEANAQRQDNNALQREPMSIQPDEQAGPATDNGQLEQNAQAGANLPNLGLQALSVNPPVPMLDLDAEDEVVPPIPPILVPREQIDREFRNAGDRLDVVELGPVNAPDRDGLVNAPDQDMPVIEVPQDEAPMEQDGVAAPVEQPRVKQPEPPEDMYSDSIDEEVSSLSGPSSSSETSTTETSDEDDFQLIPFYIPGPGNGPRVPMIYVPGRYPSGVRPIGPVARRGDLQEPSRPIVIPPPTRSRPLDDDDDSSSPEMAPTRSKRRRPNRPY